MRFWLLRRKAKSRIQTRSARLVGSGEKSYANEPSARSRKVTNPIRMLVATRVRTLVERGENKLVSVDQVLRLRNLALTHSATVPNGSKSPRRSWLEAIGSRSCATRKTGKEVASKEDMKAKRETFSPSDTKLESHRS